MAPRLVLTHAWGSADEQDVIDRIVEAGGPPPLIVRADVTRSDDTHRARGRGARAVRQGGRPHQQRVGVVGRRRDGGLHRARFSEEHARRRLADVRVPHGDPPRSVASYPRHVVVMSSDGPDRFTPGYDFVAAGKAATEAMVKYAAYRLRDEGVRINALRSRAIRTESFDGTFGRDFYGFLRQFVTDEWFMRPDEVGRAAFALCSGLFDGVSGQTIMVDRGSTFFDGISYIYERRDALGVQQDNTAPVADRDGAPRRT